MSALPESVPGLAPPPCGPSYREPAPGDLLVGRYRLLELAGEGGMARVYRARDERLGRDVAVKAQRASGQPRPPLCEERVSSDLFHPNIVAIFDGGELPAGEPGGGARFIVMEYVPGLTAYAAAPVSCARALEIADQAAAGLAAAHGRGVIHNDIKPGNILLDGAGGVKLADFGVAATAETEVGDFVHGSPAYIAPERLRGARPDPRQDVYGLGGVLAYLLTGAHPPRDAAPALPADCPAALAAVIRRARAHDPSERYADAAAFRAALAAARAPAARTRHVPPRAAAPRATEEPPRPANAAPILRRPAPRNRRAANGSQRLAAAAAAIALALLLIVVGGVIAPRIIAGDPPPAAAATTMPDLTNQTFGAAIEQLAAQGLTVERVDVVYGPGPLNQIVEQSPAPGRPLTSSDQIRIRLVVRTGR